MEISASQVRELREKTGVGLMNCKKALKEANGNLDEAIKKLRETGLAKAAKKSDRETNEGKIFIQANNGQAVIVELNCETDFVASNDDFKTVGDAISATLLENPTVNSVEELESLTIEGKSYTDFLAAYVLKLGENMSVKKFTRISADGVGTYIHMNGKIGVAVAFTGDINEDAGRDIAMHVAAANPSYVKSEEVPTEELDKESEIIRNQALNEGKPAEIVDKIVQGKLSKFYKEVCLLEQPFIKDDKVAVKNMLPANTTVTEFIRYSLV